MILNFARFLTFTDSFLDLCTLVLINIIQNSKNYYLHIRHYCQFQTRVISETGSSKLLYQLLLFIVILTPEELGGV